MQADIEAKIREQMLMYNIIDVKVRSKIMVSPAEVTDYYQKNIEQLRTSAEWEFDAVALEDKNLAFEVSDNLKKGESLRI